MFNSNIGPNYALLQDNMSDFDFDLSRSLQVRSNGAVRLTIYDILLMSNSNHMSISCHLGVIATQIFSYLLPLGPNFGSPTSTLTVG